MVNLHKEKLISGLDVTQMVPSKRRGRPTHVSTVIRWILNGVRGRRLEAVRIGGNWFTSVEALARFAQHSGPAPEPESPSPSPARSRARQADEALDRLGLGLPP